MFSKQLAHYFEVPLKADSVESPIVKYSQGLTCIDFQTVDESWGRVTFEKIDAIRVCRGESDPYPRATKSNDGYSWVSTVSNSEWLRERYEYEKKHYGSSYEFNGNVEEMLSDFSHYVFAFHDQFVEVISRGIWFEASDHFLGDQHPDTIHPLSPLSESAISERFQAHNISCQVRRNPLSIDALENNAKYCSQTILQIGTELDGQTSNHWTLSFRIRNGEKKISLRSYFGKEVETFKFVPSLNDIRPTIDAWLSEVHQRRVKMGKA